MEIFKEIIQLPDDKLRIRCSFTNDIDQKIEVHPHWHPEIEILYFIKGSAKQQVGDRIFIAEQGDIVIINREQIHSTYSYAESKCEIIVLIFDANDLIEFLSDNDISRNSFIFRSSIVFKNPIKLAENDRESILNCIKQIYSELEEKRSSYKYMVKSYLYMMTGLLARTDTYYALRENENQSYKIKQVLSKTFELIDKCYNQEITLQTAALNANYSIPHFCRLFKKAVGMTFNEYLIFYKVERSAKILDSDKNLSEIAFECGFGSISNFIRCFKKFKKCTPSQYKGY